MDGRKILYAIRSGQWRNQSAAHILVAFGGSLIRNFKEAEHQGCGAMATPQSAEWILLRHSRIHSGRGFALGHCAIDSVSCGSTLSKKTPWSCAGSSPVTCNLIVCVAAGAILDKSA